MSFPWLLTVGPSFCCSVGFLSMDLGCGAGGGCCFFVGGGVGCFAGGGGVVGGGVGCFSGVGVGCFSGDDVGCCRCGVLQARTGWCLVAGCSAGRLEGASLLLRLAFPLLDIIGGFSFALTLSFSFCSTRLCESVVGSL